MLKKCIVFVILSILLSLNLDAQTTNDEHYIIGNLPIESWFERTQWKFLRADDYPCDSMLIKDLQSRIRLRNYKFYIFAGSWCSDTESELPKIVLVLRRICSNDSNIYLFGVDRRKREPSGTAEKFNIERVPTLVVTENGKEIARVVEYPRPNFTWCDELNIILSKSKKEE